MLARLAMTAAFTLALTAGSGVFAVATSTSAEAQSRTQSRSGGYFSRPAMQQRQDNSMRQSTQRAFAPVRPAPSRPTGSFRR